MELQYTHDDLDILRNFLEETDEHIEGMEETILLLENREDRDIIDSIFRTMHTLKGTSGYLNLNHIKHLSHEAESLVGDVRAGKMSTTPNVISVLLNTTDLLQKMFKSLKQASVDPPLRKDKTYLLILPDLPYEPLVEHIKKLREDSEKKEDPSPQSAITPEEKIPKMTDSEVLGFIQEATKSVEGLKNAIQDYTSEENRKSAMTQFKVHFTHFQKLAQKIQYNTLIAKLGELDNLYDFLEKGEPEMADSILSALRDGVRVLSQLIDHSKLKIDSRRDPSMRTRANDREDDREETVISTIRVHGERLDKFMNLIGELVVSKNVFGGLAEELRLTYGLMEMSKKVKDAGSVITRIAEDLQMGIMETRMMPVKSVFSRYIRMVHDLAQVTGKPLKLTMEGEETELDKTVIEKIGDPLVHMIRNSADHGIESPSERTKAGKPQVGKIHLRAIRKAQQVLIEVQDDGRGLSREKIIKKAIEKGLVTQEATEAMDNESIYQLLMAPGFSTAENVTELSGRGVGLDVVRSNVEKIGGMISITSEEGVGSRVTMAIPLTLMVTRGLQIEAENELFILPLESVMETLKIPPEQVKNWAWS
ncbi:chemotaxis protein CheA [Deltaproteobacteria bacterium TL4]